VSQQHSAEATLFITSLSHSFHVPAPPSRQHRWSHLPLSGEGVMAIPGWILGCALAIVAIAPADACDAAAPGSGKSLRFSHPSDGPLISSFGMRTHPVTRAVRMHPAVDFRSEIGVAVRAGAAGRVVVACEQNRYGKIVTIAHGDGVETSYAHLSRIDVRDGDCIDRGTTLGASGVTQTSGRPLLHFEVRVNGRFFDPAWRLEGLH